MDKNLSRTAIWEVYKYLSQNVLSEEELDLYFCLTNFYLEKETSRPFSERLYKLTNCASNGKVKLEENNIQHYIKVLQIKKSLV